MWMLTEVGGRGISQGCHFSELIRKGKNPTAVGDSEFWLRPFKTVRGMQFPRATGPASVGWMSASAEHTVLDTPARKRHGAQEQGSNVRLLTDLP